jgi:DNA primase
MIPNDFIQTLLSRIDVVDVVDRYVPLKKAGANYVACCPFHSEKTPSFTVSQTKQFYHCFGCGAHGTAVGFLMEYGGKSFPDAVEELARDAGLEVPRVEARPGESERREQAEDLASLLLAAQSLRPVEGRAAAIRLPQRTRTHRRDRRALRHRVCPGCVATAAAAFEVRRARARETAGLVIAGTPAALRRFRDRIMFPIHDSGGRG